MRTTVLMILVLSVLAGGVVGQPKDGDIVFTSTLRTPTTVSYVAYLDPVNPSTVKVFSTAPTGTTISGVRMERIESKPVGSSTKACIFSVSGSSGFLQYDLGQHVVVQLEGGGHEKVATFGDAPSA